MISLVAKSASNTLMKIITLDSFGTPKDYTCVNSDDSTYNYFEEKISPSEFSDIELEVFLELISENLLTCFSCHCENNRSQESVSFFIF
jgi:hypothetical protein